MCWSVERQRLSQNQIMRPNLPVNEPKGISFKKLLLTASASAALLFHTGCATNWQTTALGVGAATAVGAYSPANEIDQMYYLGEVDPQGQMPPAFYRIRVKGQASFISGTKFASGWVPAALIDSLGSKLSIDQNTGTVSGTAAVKELHSVMTPTRTSLLFGPEGVREAPKDHRLVVVMGTSPEKFFKAIDSVLGDLSSAQAEKTNNELNKELLKALSDLRVETALLTEAEKDLATFK